MRSFTLGPPEPRPLPATHLAALLGVATAVAVLGGALVVATRCAPACATSC
jgi:hypothetical protein